MHEDRLLEVLHSLDSRIKRQTSLKFIFIMGLIYGLGTVIGATILIALLSGVLASVLGDLGLDGLVNYLNSLKSSS